MSTNLFLSTSYPNIQLSKSSVASAEFRSIADATIYGTPGKMRYAHTKGSEKIGNLQNTVFLEFKRNDQTLGIVALVGHTVNIDQLKIAGHYVRYFSMNTPMRSTHQRAKKGHEKRGVLHQTVKELFDDPDKLQLGHPTIVYAFVESTNDRSLNMVKSMDFKPYRELVTLIFSRFYPKIKLKIKGISEEQIPHINALLNTFYENYNLVPDFNEDWNGYLIHEVDGEILLGGKLETNSWKIHEMPGFDGWLFRKFLPHIPILNRIFQKDKIDFIGIERLYVKTNYEHMLPQFLESLCNKYKVTKALIGVDNRSPLHDLLQTKGKLGLLNQLITPSPGILFSRAHGISERENQSLLQKPFYVSTYDMS